MYIYIYIYIYLGQLIKLKKDHDREIKRRIKIGWITFGKNRDILKSKMPICLKRKICNRFVIATMTYGCETWKLTKQTKSLFRIAQRAMEKAMLGITLRDRERSTWIRENVVITMDPTRLS